MSETTYEQDRMEVEVIVICGRETKVEMRAHTTIAQWHSAPARARAKLTEVTRFLLRAMPLPEIREHDRNVFTTTDKQIVIDAAGEMKEIDPAKEQADKGQEFIRRLGKKDG